MVGFNCVRRTTDSGGQAPVIFGLGLIFVFLVLAAQYENYVDPLIILLSVPLAILGALLAQSLRGLTNDVFCQVGLVMLIGLASKNAILIVEFANQLREQQGLSITKAVVQASQERLRPILMTAFSTLLGIFPLVSATGAGAASRRISWYGCFWRDVNRYFFEFVCSTDFVYRY